MSKHISIRVPWHDSDWNGSVCAKPQNNLDCSRLKNIGEDRLLCVPHAGRGPENWPKDFRPPCLRENGLFMGGCNHAFMAHHPYVRDTHFSHIRDTKFDCPQGSFIAIPFAWMLKPEDDGESIHARYYTAYNPDIELSTLRFGNVAQDINWISNGENQRNILNYFWHDINPEESLVVSYAKSIPLTETSGRVVTSISRIKALGELVEYDYTEQPDGEELFQAFCWEMTVNHGIGGEEPEGFVFPFVQIKKYLEEHPETNPDDLLLIVPSDYQAEFSYGCEHVSHEALIIVINRAIELLRKYRNLGFTAPVNTSWKKLITWCKACLEQVWKERGRYPGFGNILTALGLPYGNDIYDALRKSRKHDKKENGAENTSGLFRYLLESFNEKGALTDRLPENLHPAIAGVKRSKLLEIRDVLAENEAFWLTVARINIRREAAKFLYDCLEGKEDSEYRGFAHLSSLPTLGESLAAAVTENPYILYEETRLLPPQYIVGISEIDLAFFPPEEIAARLFANGQKLIEDPGDKRRLRALITSILEDSAEREGNTLLPVRYVLARVNEYRPELPGIDVEISIRNKTLQHNEDFFAAMFSDAAVHSCNADNDKAELSALQLGRFTRLDDVIREFTATRLERSPYPRAQVNWLDETERDREKFAASIAGYPEEQQRSLQDKRQRVLREQADALEKIYSAPLSVLTGGAGTGKTHVLTRLCADKAIQAGGILVLAPTGKARIVLKGRLRERGIEAEALTIAQFLNRNGHMLGETFSPYLTGHAIASISQTVIIDESSMLTEDQFGVLCEVLAKAKRVIFAGDPNQLPPIGAGRPFFELCRKLEENKPEYFSKLTISSRRNNCDGSRGVDEEFAAFFTADGSTADIEDLLELTADGQQPIEFIPCTTADDLGTVLDQVLSKTFTLINGDTDANTDPRTQFALSLGGTINDMWMNFDNSTGVENWQILSPYRNRELIGSNSINQRLHDVYGKDPDLGNGVRKQKIRRPYGLQGICKGEKVINLENQNKISQSRIWNIDNIENPENTTANGEIGITARYASKDKSCEHPYVHYSSQPGLLYRYYGTYSEDAPLELAYALTVHKGQGSGFRITIVVLVDNGYRSFISREMLYTALTRHSNKIFIITNQTPAELLKGSDVKNSDIARRITNIFATPQLVCEEEDDYGWYDQNLIHKALDGTLLRSKSELVIYNMLKSAGLEPQYEQRLVFPDGMSLLPDFTFIDSDGREIYWEHLGMLGNTGYCQHWQRKQECYSRHGISEAEGNLIISRDDRFSGALDSEQIQKKINELAAKLIHTGAIYRHRFNS